MKEKAMKVVFLIAARCSINLYLSLRQWYPGN